MSNEFSKRLTEAAFRQMPTDPCRADAQDVVVAVLRELEKLSSYSAIGVAASDALRELDGAL